MILVVKKGLANPAQTPIPIGAGFHPARSVELSYARPREKAKTGIEPFAELIESVKAVEEVVRIVDDVTPAGPAPPWTISTAERGPAHHLKILATEQL